MSASTRMLVSKSYNHFIHNQSVLQALNNNLGRVLSGVANRLYSSKGPESKGCENVSQTAGRRVEPWPQTDDHPPPMWRKECSQDPLPLNYDPYRIKVPEIVVPPLPPSNAKEKPSEDARLPFKHSETNFQSDFQSNASYMQDLLHNSPLVHPDYWKDKPVKNLSDVVKEERELPKLGYHGRNKYKYAFHEPWRPLDRLALLAQAEKQELVQLEALIVETNTKLTEEQITQ